MDITKRQTNTLFNIRDLLLRTANYGHKKGIKAFPEQAGQIQKSFDYLFAYNDRTLASLVIGDYHRKSLITFVDSLIQYGDDARVLVQQRFAGKGGGSDT